MTYDASGMKLSKVVKQGAAVASRMDYIKGLEYHNNKLQAIYHSEGLVAYCDATQTQSITAPINGETKNFKAGMITAASSITGSSNVTMQAATNMTYLPGFQVEQGSPFLGSILPPPYAVATAYEYVIRDHLGNGRIYFADYDGNNLINATTEILQEAPYDPWGYALGGSWVNNPDVDNLYQYNACPSEVARRRGKELNNDIGFRWYDYGARWYDAGVGRWTSVDPMADKNNHESPFVYVHNNPINAIDPDGKDAILIAFPDYKISRPIGRVGNLGHAGVLLIDNKSARTKYYEYGRYDKAEVGLVRNVKVANIKIGSDGKPTEKSIQRVLKQISGQSGQNGRIEGAYIDSDKFDEMNNYAKERLSQNSDLNRDPYSLTSNNCGTFGCDVINQDPEVAKQAPLIFDPRPNSMIKEYQGEFGKVKYDPKSGSSVETVDQSKYQEFLDKLKKQFERP